MNYTIRKRFLDAALKYTKGDTSKALTRPDVIIIAENAGIRFPAWFTDNEYRIGRGRYSLKRLYDDIQLIEQAERETPFAVAADVVSMAETMQPDGSSMKIPPVDKTFIPFGVFNKIEKVVQSKIYVPTLVYGLPGVGKTTAIEQVAAQEKIGLQSVVVTPTMKIGDIFSNDGPVIHAYEHGEILLLDEINNNPEIVFALQRIIDGMAIQSGERIVQPNPTFKLFATANVTKPDELGDALADRFVATFTQSYPNQQTEETILTRKLAAVAGSVEPAEKKFIHTIVKWANLVRDSFENGDIDYTISTRRLVNIVKFFAVFGDENEAVKCGTDRFGPKIQDTLISVFKGLQS